MDKIKAFVAILEDSKFKQHRLGNANLGMCYVNFAMDDLLSMLAEKHERAKEAGILTTDFYDDVYHVQVTYKVFQRLTIGVREIHSKPSIHRQNGYEHLFAEVDGIHLVTVKKVENEKMQVQ